MGGVGGPILLASPFATQAVQAEQIQGAGKLGTTADNQKRLLSSNYIHTSS
jgi:hypothetical protein